MTPRAALIACLMGAGMWGWQVSSCLAAGQTEPRPVLFTNVHVEGYDCGRQQVLLTAARAYTGTRRFGFFKTALLPTLELEEVAVAWLREDGAREQRYLQDAVIDWTSKTVLTPAGESLSPARQPRRVEQPHLLQDLCL